MHVFTRARGYSDHGYRRRRRRRSSSRTLSGSSPGLALHLLLHHVQLLGESRAGTLLRPDDDGCNFLSGARKQQKKHKKKVGLDGAKETDGAELWRWCRTLEKGGKWKQDAWELY